MHTEELDCCDAGWEPGWPEGGKKATVWPSEGPGTTPPQFVSVLQSALCCGEGARAQEQFSLDLRAMSHGLLSRTSQKIYLPSTPPPSRARPAPCPPRQTGPLVGA